MDVDEKHNPTTIMLNCLIASTASALVYMIIDLFVMEKATIKKILPEPIHLMHAALSGLFAISAGCNNISQRDSFFVGVLNAILYAIAIKVYLRFKIDDPCQSSIVHGVSGFWGVISVGLFDATNGLFYAGNSNLIKIQAIGTLAILTWSIVLSFGYFFTVSKLGRLRIPSVYETIGIDLLAHSCIKDLESFKKSSQSTLKDFTVEQRIMFMLGNQNQNDKNLQVNDFTTAHDEVNRLNETARQEIVQQMKDNKKSETPKYKHQSPKTL